MTEFEREERALRDAFAQHASQAPVLPELRRPARRGRAAAITAAAVAAAVIGGFALPALFGDRALVDPSGADQTTRVDETQWQWVGLRALEVRAPIGWDFAHEVSRPDCINTEDPNDPWAKGVPDAPYVTVAPVAQISLSIGCTAARPGNPDPAFGDLPFPLWQPYVGLELAGPDAGKQSDRRDGQWTHEGWQLSRRTLGDVHVSVLTAPDGPDIAEQVFASARTVETNHIGCETTSPFGDGFPQPEGNPVPPDADVQAIAVCDYSRIDGDEGLQGSWLMKEQQAQDLTSAILTSPAGDGPNEPQNCSPDMVGDSAVVLRFFGADNSVLADAYVYSQSCLGNGIVTSSGSRTLTVSNCSPVFSRPEVTWWIGQTAVMRLCRP